MTVALSASAGFGNGPWGNNGWGGNNINNGFIAHNPNSLFTPDWFSEEMDDMMDEFDGNNTPWNSNGFNNNGQWNNNNGPWNNRNFGNNTPWQNNNWNQSPWGNSQPFNFLKNSFAPMNNGPWNNATPVRNTPTK